MNWSQIVYALINHFGYTEDQLRAHGGGDTIHNITLLQRLYDEELRSELMRRGTEAHIRRAHQREQTVTVSQDSATPQVPPPAPVATPAVQQVPATPQVPTPPEPVATPAVQQVPTPPAPVATPTPIGQQQQLIDLGQVTLPDLTPARDGYTPQTGAQRRQEYSALNQQYREGTINRSRLISETRRRRNEQIESDKRYVIEALNLNPEDVANVIYAPNGDLAGVVLKNGQRRLLVGRDSESFERARREQSQNITQQPGRQDLSSLEQPTPESADMMGALLAGFNEGSTRTQAGSGTQYAQAPTDQTVMSDAMPEPAATQEEPNTHAEPEQQPPAAQNLTFSSGVDQRINPEIASKVQQIESAFGKTLTVSSGFRDPARNARVGGARNSAHTRGNAVDLVFSGNEEDTVKLIEKASAAGIGGIGVYRAGWVHLDTENKRVWGRDFTNRSIPQWARAALNAHMTGRRDGERQQPAAPETPSMEPNAQPASGVMAEGGGAAQDMAAAATPQQQQPQTGMQMLSESQENAVAERTPAPPTVIQSQETPAGEATQGADVGGVFESADDPGPVEPDDAATRYARLFNMAA
jgi:hypothetical protein